MVGIRVTVVLWAGGSIGRPTPGHKCFRLAARDVWYCLFVLGKCKR